ncbi:sensor histidine kinase [Thermoactinospora rubra]|uniref:sensor histidine kinase n=1 Tax=Thermoactinospora rubra TaxID=1088767 RepID=UPI0011815FAE|nr:histidine kinase [Thermoactinospora rubra]
MGSETRMTRQFERLRRATLWSVAGVVVMPWMGLAVYLTDKPDNLLLGFAVAVPALALFSHLYVRAARAAVAGRVAIRELAATAAIAVALMVVFNREPIPMGLLGICWGALAVLNTTRLVAVLVYLGTLAVSYALSPGEGVLFFYGVVGGITVLASRFQFWFWQVVAAAQEGREAQAKLAVTEERLRFSRDLHDVVGHRLSAIAVKCELAARLAGTDAAAAETQMREARGLAREALREIREVVQGYRTVDLAAELRSVRAVLEAAGIACRLRLPGQELPHEVGTVLAWLVREGSTNVLRHADATWCRITVAAAPDRVELTLANDGMRGPAGTAGSGVIGMTERVTALGGTLTAGPGPRPGEYVLSAKIPYGGPPRRPEHGEHGGEVG